MRKRNIEIGLAGTIRLFRDKELLPGRRVERNGSERRTIAGAEPVELS